MKCIARWGDLRRLFALLQSTGHILYGPKAADSAVVIGEIASTEDLAVGWSDSQNPGSYRLHKHSHSPAFAFHSGADSWKRLLLPPRSTLWEADRTASGFEVLPSGDDSRPTAFIGMHGCDVTAMLRLDHVFGFQDDRHPSPGSPRETSRVTCIDPCYASIRRSSFVVGVQCTGTGGNCFCSSVGAGPHIEVGCDLVLTELPDEPDPLFHLKALTSAGERALADLSLREAGPDHDEKAKNLVDQCAAAMPRSLDLSGIRELLHRNWDHGRWQATANRCLTCGNCTMVCPTCFCTNILDETDLAGRRARRLREWDSCFSLEFSYIHGGGNVRSSAKARYRHWMAHKLAAWIDQFGELGCVGCGRCITWCPAGIDITEEAAVIRETDGAAGLSSEEKCHVRS
jgi:formate hydrogenlyase subunit 6/NADH:ubiquinone oxidoreductase subunit I